jgi:hypothetical protein
MIADYFTKFPIVEALPDHAPSSVIASIVSRYCGIMGKPDIIRSDNGPHFSGNAFQRFTKTWNIQHKTSSPHHPRSNGFVERMIGTAKPIMKKALAAGQDIDLALLRWRTTPISNKINSSSELMFEREITDTLPSRLNYRSTQKEDIVEHLTSQQEVSKRQYDEHTKPLPPLYIGQGVWTQDPQSRRWEQATVLEAVSHRSYILEKNGRRIRRNRVLIRPSHRPVDESHPAPIILPTSTAQLTTPLPTRTHRNANPNQNTLTQTHNTHTSPTSAIRHTAQNTQPKRVHFAPLPHNTRNEPYITRSGRVVKTPSKLK